MELKVINCERKDLENMSVLKYNKSDKKPKIWTKNNLFLKHDISDIASRYKEEFEFFSEFKDLENCIFPEYIWTLDNKKYGYVTTYYKEYVSLLHRIEKANFSLEAKKVMIFKIIELVNILHEYGIVHGDLHPYNIIYNKFNIKFVDFDNIRFDHIESESIYKMRLKEEINNLNITLLSILFEKFLSHIKYEDYIYIIENLKICEEFKNYLISSSNYEENTINEDLPLYINSIRNNDIFEGKNIIKSLKL